MGLRCHVARSVDRCSMVIGFQLQRFNDLTCREHLAVASHRVKTQITLHRERFFLTFHFIFREKSHGRRREQIRRKRTGQVLCR
jgi:hypothetical protein